MKNANDISVARLRGPLLRSVSRSFYLSIRLLPERVRDPIALAYLLARATDTIADATTMSGPLRMEKLRALAAAIQGNSAPNELANLRDPFGPLPGNDAERVLIESLPLCLAWLESLGENDRRDIREVLEKINRGQSLDVERFDGGNGMRALATASELDEYTYLVAGCVGEFWTRVCFRHVPRFASRSEEEMAALGVRYGKGLQLVNILRDAGADLRSGRCHLADDELGEQGISAVEILSEPGRVEPVMKKWRTQAAAGLAAGLEYACAIRLARVRFATVLPALIGTRTLALLEQAGAEALERTIKVSRPEVRKILAKAALTLAAPRSLRKMFARLCSVATRSQTNA